MFPIITENFTKKLPCEPWLLKINQPIMIANSLIKYLSSGVCGGTSFHRHDMIYS